MRNQFITGLATLCTILTVNAQEPEPKDAHARKSYSYIGLGYNHIDYKEETTPIPGYLVEADADGIRMAQRSGGYVAIEPDLGFYINTTSVFGTHTIEETWTINGLAVQNNEFSYKQSDIHVLIAHQFSDKHHFLWGGGLLDTTFTRFHFQYPEQDVYPIDESSENVSEDISQFIAYLGYEYNELYTHQDSKWRWQFQLLAGIPLYSETLNNSGSGATFEASFDGYIIRSIPSLAYQISEHVALGFSLDISYNQRDEDETTNTIRGQRTTVILPDNTTLLIQPAFSAYWAF